MPCYAMLCSLQSDTCDWCQLLGVMTCCSESVASPRISSGAKRWRHPKLHKVKDPPHNILGSPRTSPRVFKAIHLGSSADLPTSPFLLELPPVNAVSLWTTAHSQITLCKQISLPWSRDHELNPPCVCVCQEYELLGTSKFIWKN